MFGIFVGVSSACGEFVFSVCSLPNVPLNYFQEAAHRTASYSRGSFLIPTFLQREIIFSTTLLISP